MCLIRNEKEDAAYDFQKYRNKTHIIKKWWKIHDSIEKTKNNLRLITREKIVINVEISVVCWHQLCGVRIKITRIISSFPRAVAAISVVFPFSNKVTQKGCVKKYEIYNVYYTFEIR